MSLVKQRDRQARIQKRDFNFRYSTERSVRLWDSSRSHTFAYKIEGLIAIFFSSFFFLSFFFRSFFHSKLLSYAVIIGIDKDCTSARLYRSDGIEFNMYTLERLLFILDENSFQGFGFQGQLMRERAVKKYQLDWVREKSTNEHNSFVERTMFFKRDDSSAMGIKITRCF